MVAGACGSAKLLTQERMGVGQDVGFEGTPPVTCSIQLASPDVSNPF